MTDLGYSAPGHPHDGYAYDGCKCVCCTNIRALAASPSPDTADWTVLANDIRLVDGNHDLGAGELAARLIERGWTRPSPDTDAVRSQDTATARIADLEGAVEWACDIAALATEQIDDLVQTGWSSASQRKAKAIVNSFGKSIAKCRAVLSGETRTGGT